MSWHATPHDLDLYARGALGDSSAASLELHLTSCASCRAMAADRADRSSVSRAKAALDLRLDEPPRPWWERGLGRLGVSESTTRLLAASARLQGSWVAAGLVAVAFSLSAAVTSSNRIWLAAFLVLAPVVPLLGVAMAFGPRVDPAYEIAVASPMAVGRLVLVRSVAVIAVSVPIMAVLSFLLPGANTLAFAWLLPALGLAAVSLALGSWVPVTRAAVVLAAVWGATAVVALSGAPRTSADAFARGFVAFRPAGQIAFALATLVAGAVVLARRSTTMEVLR